MKKDQEENQVKLPKKDDPRGDLPETEEDWVRYVNKCHDQGLATRRKYEFQWVVNLAYYMGYQHLVYDPVRGSLSIPTDLKQPLTINRIGSFVESRQAKLIKNRPIPRVIPNSNEPEDTYGATNADKALLHIWREVDSEAEQDKLTMLMLITGTAFVETLWDPTAGDVMKVEKKSEDGLDLILDEDGVVDEEEVFMGDVSSKALSAFSIIPANDSVPEVKNQEWIIKRTHMSIIDVETLYPHLIGKIKREDKEASFTEYEKIVQRLSSPVFHSTGLGADLARDSLNSQVLVKTMYIKPNYQYKKGVVIVTIGDLLAMIDVWPNDYGRKNVYPVVKFMERVNGLHFWAQATIERLISIQKAYNKLKQQKAKNAALMANLKWMVPKGAQLMEEALNDEEGEVVEYNPAVAEPHAAQIAPMPAYVTELARELITDFRDVGGQRESSVTPPPNLTAGVAMQIAAEMSDEIMGPIVKRYGTSLAAVATQQLMIADQEWTDPRKIKVLGDGGEIAVMWMNNLDLKHNTDVHIDVESLYPEFRGTKRQTLLDFWDRRIIQDPQKILKAYRYGNFDMLLDEEEQLQETVVLDIAMIKKGKEPEIHQFQNHMLYVKELSKWVQTPDFLRLIPERKQLAIQVLQAHIAMIMQQMPNQGQPMGQTNQAAVGTPFGAAKPEGAM